MGQAQGMGKKSKFIQEEKIMEDPGTQEVLPKLKGIITHQHIQLGIHMHLKNHRATQKCPQSNIKGEGMNKIVCKERLED
jgi:hypothetical protein